MTLSPQLLGLTILLLLVWVCPQAPLWALKKKKVMISNASQVPILNYVQ